MQNSKKINLDRLVVKSFVVNLDDKQRAEAKGGICTWNCSETIRPDMCP